MADVDVEALQRLLAGDDGADSDPPAPSKNPMADIRKQLDTLLKEKKVADKKLEAQDKELSGYRTAVETTVYDKFQLNKANRALFRALNPETAATDDSISAFMAEYEIAAPPAEGEAEGKVPDAVTAPDLKPTTVVGASATPRSVYTVEEWTKLSASDPEAGQAAYKAGRVDLSGLREGLGPEK